MESPWLLLGSTALPIQKSALRFGKERENQGLENHTKMLDLLFVKHGFTVLGAESMWLQVRWKQFD